MARIEVNDESSLPTVDLWGTSSDGSAPQLIDFERIVDGDIDGARERLIARYRELGDGRDTFDP